MKRKPRNHGGGRKDSPVLTQLAKLIDCRLPDQHGFALLTFPLGAAVDPVMRYVGKGDRDDILTAMQAWIDQQRQKGGPYWGTHDMAAAATQWTSQRPTAPGLSLLKHPKDAFPSYIRITDAPDRGALSMDEWIGEQFAASFEDLADLAPEHIWLGPIPQPWNLGLQTVAPEAAEPSNVTPIRPTVEADELTAFFARIDQHHGEPLAQMLADLTRGVPPEGGNVRLDTIRDLLKTAFQVGVLAQHDQPMP